MACHVRYVDHTYRDYSTYVQDGGELVKHKKSGNNFPARLHEVVSDEANSHAIAWMVRVIWVVLSWCVCELSLWWMLCYLMVQSLTAYDCLLTFVAIHSLQPHGRAFKIINKEKLISDVLPGYLVCKKYESFSRQLNVGIWCVDVMWIRFILQLYNMNQHILNIIHHVQGWGFKRLHQSGPGMSPLPFTLESQDCLRLNLFIHHTIFLSLSISITNRRLWVLLSWMLPQKTSWTDLSNKKTSS